MIIDALYGIAGLLAFELVRARRRYLADKSLVPRRRRWQFFFTLGLLVVVTGLIANAFAKGDAIEAVLIGFSITSLATNSFGSSPGIDGTDDIMASKITGTLPKIRYFFGKYFNFG